MNTIRERVRQFRELMQKKQVDAWILPSNDAHNSEYVADYWKGRAWLSGFTGSAGTLVVTREEAGLWTDGRYFIQAEKELEGSGIKLFRMFNPGVPSLNEWLADTLSDNAVIGFDGKVISQNQAKGLLDAFADKPVTLSSDDDLLSAVWEERPALPVQAIFRHEDRYAGKSCQEKLSALRSVMTEKNAGYHLLSTLDDIAWSLNLRGSDVSMNPVFISYLLVGHEQATVFVDSEKLDDQLVKYLAESGVETQPYENVWASLSQLPDDASVLLDPAKASRAIFDALPDSVTAVEGKNPSTAMKAIKNETEIEHFRQALRKDGVAMVRFMKWLESEVPGGNVTELSAEAKLTQLRAEMEGYKEDSFRTIAGYREHGAMMHYAASDESDVTVQPGSFFLVDSGGQYPDGTTDITRTFSYGDLTEQEKKDYTLVLQGHVDLTTAVFKTGSCGCNLDILARGPLWKEGIDYGCGTGHGVGFFLNVHEGPQGFSQKLINEPLKPGMIITNEPGIYREGIHGVRIENIMLVKEHSETEFGSFLSFEAITLAPICTRAINVEELSRSQRQWLNHYHQTVYEQLAPMMNEEERAYLKLKTAAV
ncbi:aminopeptidase P family protein [Endozoicomonas sp.]|uniref:aminopeptidase P family protein n=1 Tax=Endozoicomonas sp. TaxID=1892382 RepID=UPI003D9AD5F1